eukprot:CAMPEP_0113279620 /NCGR_PEP_ID=MMETSP0008_2-20120614/27283_1 /TAXON_ID=97485 /ORGANISM="Prymnesium parvum" /LENGTH=49 /DNA_ID=CAMNT_0000129819 /DNA_START=137 /DNA_END=286 /DNA_ORIENTATION=- /assembly_acc=CAM_ASM_000153
MWEAHHVESQCMWAQAGASESDTHMLPQSAFRAEDAAQEVAKDARRLFV